MTNYSIVIPTYGRAEYLKNCLASIEGQTAKPEDVFVIDNNESVESQKTIKDIVEGISSSEINFRYFEGKINSGAVARNYGASKVGTELVAFLDDDVVLDDDYYEKILDVFQSDTNIVGVQGLDRDLIESFQKNVRGKLMGWIWLSIENFFQHASIIKDKRSGVSPSLAVMHPIPDIDFCLESQWISTCAGVFKTNLFDIVEFPKGFVKYSWNEYLFFSYSIYKKKLGTMVYTSEPKYRNIQTDAGRLPLKDLVYMAEVYDLYIFSQLFNSNFSDRLIYLKSRLGRLLYNTLRTVVRREFNFKLIRKKLIRNFIFIPILNIFSKH
mgnify:CR=1 FL=1